MLVWGMGAELRGISSSLQDYNFIHSIKILVARFLNPFVFKTNVIA